MHANYVLQPAHAFLGAGLMTSLIANLLPFTYNYARQLREKRNNYNRGRAHTSLVTLAVKAYC